MRYFTLALLSLILSTALYAQTGKAVNNNQDDPNNIYSIKRRFEQQVIHNTADNDDDNDNDANRFNRWFNMMEPRCYPTGNMPEPDVLLRSYSPLQGAGRKGLKTSAISPWQPVGPKKVPINHNGIGRVNCIVLDPIDTATIYVGTAGGGVHISHDNGATWTSNSDNFPSISIADIAVNPRHTDTIYAATGDGYGYENGSSIFWGGLYSGGIMKSPDGGKTWLPTGLSYLQSNRDIIQRLLINSVNPDILLAATRHGILRSADAGATWDTVDAGHVYSMAYRPGNAAVIYAINDYDLRISSDTGKTWTMLNPGINPTADRCSIAVSAASPNSIWLLDSKNNFKFSHDYGYSFYPGVSPDPVANFYGYYDRVLSVSPTDSNLIFACGKDIAKSTNGGASWSASNPMDLHVDNHALTINPLRKFTVYVGDDGGISVSYNGGTSWTNLADGLMISQMYKMATSQQNPYMMLTGVQDNGTFGYNGTDWAEVSYGDGMDCAIHPKNDFLQISSSQYGYFNLSYDQGITFNHIDVTSEKGSWITPVLFDPNNQQNIYFGYQHIWGSRDGGSSFEQLSKSFIFSSGAISMAIGQSNSAVLYAADYTNIYRSLDSGTTWKNVTGNLPTSTVAMTNIAVDYNDPMLVYVTMSGYVDGKKVFVSTAGGTTWTNISSNLPNVPANCIAVDSSTPGALFVGTDMGVYYIDSSNTSWAPYSTGLPNVIVDDIDINYYNYYVRAATYGRGVWEAKLIKDAPDRTGVRNLAAPNPIGAYIYPNPAESLWRLNFTKPRPASYIVKLLDLNGKVLRTEQNAQSIDASGLPEGIYTISIVAGTDHYNLKAIKK